MLTIRFITAAAVLVTAVAAAAAQGSDTAGKPVPLLQVLSQPAEKTTAKPRLSRHAARRLAKKSHEHEGEEQTEPTQTEPAEQTGRDATASPATVASPTASVWTAGGATPLPGVATDATAPTVIPIVDQNLSAVVVGGHTVQIATPDEFNAIDLAADHPPHADADTSAASAASAPATVLAEPDDHARDVWYEELLATLGGALAAGAVAWFLVMGGSQQRMYG
jgi:hypothetical protein